MDNGAVKGKSKGENQRNPEKKTNGHNDQNKKDTAKRGQKKSHFINLKTRWKTTSMYNEDSQGEIQRRKPERNHKEKSKYIGQMKKGHKKK